MQARWTTRMPPTAPAPIEFPKDVYHKHIFQLIEPVPELIFSQGLPKLVQKLRKRASAQKLIPAQGAPEASPKPQEDCIDCAKQQQ